MADSYHMDGMTDEEWDDWTDDDVDEFEQRDDTCSMCNGTGDDYEGLGKCPKCDGEGFYWWL